MRLLTRAFVGYVIERVKRGPDISGPRNSSLPWWGRWDLDQTGTKPLFLKSRTCKIVLWPTKMRDHPLLEPEDKGITGERSSVFSVEYVSNLECGERRETVRCCVPYPRDTMQNEDVRSASVSFSCACFRRKDVHLEEIGKTQASAGIPCP